MRVLVTGATGFIGRRLVAELVGAGHAVDATSRNAPRARGSLGGVTAVHEWDPMVGLIPPDAIRPADAVIHLLGESVAGYWTKEKKHRIRESRVASTRHLVASIEALDPPHRPAVLLSASAIGIYGDRGDEQLSEESALGEDFLAGVCRDWESEAHQASPLGVRVACLRTGLVLGNGGLLGVMKPVFKLGLGGRLGSGEQYWPWIHLDDVAGLYRWALESDVEGAVNAVGPDPIRQVEFARALGHVLRRPTPWTVPAWALRLILGEFASESLSSHRVVPERARAGGYVHRFTEVEAALRDVG
jgi:hypothetical protein